VILVNGGSVVNLVAVWRAHGLPAILRECWEAGVVLAGWSAGSVCWHAGGPTDSFSDALDPFLDGLGFLPYSNGVHDDFTGQPRRQVYRALVAAGTLPPGYASEDGVGLHYVGTELHEAVTVRPGAAAWWVDRDGHRRIPARPLEPTGTAPLGPAAGGAATVPRMPEFVVRPVGRVESSLVDRDAAPRQGDEGAPECTIVLEPEYAAAARDVTPGAELLVLTWLDRADRDVQVVRPRGDADRPETGVFSTRSPDRPNPIGLHRVTVSAVDGSRLRVRDLEALDGTPVLDLKPVLGPAAER
jgi:tRNA-Thr(GGU) m(6)t(6)A37 methyltransferase TsaA